MELTHYLNLKMVQVCEHQVLCELDTKPLMFDKTLISTKKALNHVQYMLSIPTDVALQSFD